MSLWFLFWLVLPSCAVEVRTGQPELPAASPVAPLSTPALPGLAPAASPLNGPAVVPSVPAALPEAPSLPAAAVPIVQGPAAAAPPAEPPRALAGPLDQRFAELVSAFEHKRDTLAEGNSPVDAAARGAIINRVRGRFNAQLEGMSRAEPEDKPLLDLVGREGNALLIAIDGLMAKGEIDPRAKFRASPSDPPVPVVDRELRVGVYPVAADPFQWGHLLIALRAVEAFRLDKVVFVLAGDDPRKPNMTKTDFRHPMGRAVLDEFAPFFEYSAIAVGTQHDGETNIFRILSLNPGQRMQAFYLVGGDHYRLKDKNGNPDTLPKLESNRTDPGLGFNPAIHAIKAAFIQREGSEEHVPTTLETFFLPEVPFAASSTLVRDGKHALMPYSAYRYVQRRRPGLYGVPAAASDAE